MRGGGGGGEKRSVKGTKEAGSGPLRGLQARGRFAGGKLEAAGREAGPVLLGGGGGDAEGVDSERAKDGWVV